MKTTGAIMNPATPPQHPFKSKSFLHSLGYALNGIKTVLQTERNFRTHAILTVLVTAAGLFFRVSTTDWALLVLCITLMLVVEALNTAIEYMVDLWAEGYYSERAKLVKDIAAGACLMTATGTSITGFIIFLPYIFIYFKKIP
jgi:diacylglycerol kinase